MNMIEAAAVHVRFGDRVVLESVDLAVAEGEFHGVMGPNGAGKTTFFNVLTGRVKPNRGRVLLAGEDVTGLSPHRIAAKGIARSFQIMTLFDEFSARDNVMMGLPEFRARGHDIARAAAGDSRFAAKSSEALAAVGLADKGDIRAKDLSLATGARWRSRSPWRRRPGCCAWTSRPPASAPTGCSGSQP